MTTDLLRVFTEQTSSCSGNYTQFHALIQWKFHSDVRAVRGSLTGVTSQGSNRTLQEVLHTGTNVSHVTTTSLKASVLATCMKR